MKKELKDLVKGDKVRIIAEAKHNKNKDYNQFKIGDIYTIEDYCNTYVKTTCDKRLSIVDTSTYDIECEHYDEIENNYEIYLSSQLEEVTKKLEKLQAIHESVYKTGSNFAPTGFGTIQSETNIETLIKIASSQIGKERVYDEAAKELGLSQYPVYKDKGYTKDEIITDIKLRVAILTTENKRNELLEIKRGFEELMDKDDKLALLNQRIANL